MGRVMLQNFSFKLAVPKIKRKVRHSKIVTSLLYCLSFKDDNEVWKAKVNTKNVDGYPDFIICEFTEKSHQIKGKENLFYKQKDENGHWVRLILPKEEALNFNGNPETYSPFCEHNVYSGYLVKVNGIIQFNVSKFIGYENKCKDLLE